MSEVTILQIGNNILVPMPLEIDDMAVRKLQQDILNRIEKVAARGLVIDVSAVAIIDSFLARILVETSKMADLMGTQTVIVGMKKEVVLTLIHLGMVIRDLKTALTLEDGLRLLAQLTGGA